MKNGTDIHATAAIDGPSAAELLGRSRAVSAACSRAYDLAAATGDSQLLHLIDAAQQLWERGEENARELVAYWQSAAAARDRQERLLRDIRTLIHLAKERYPGSEASDTDRAAGVSQDATSSGLSSARLHLRECLDQIADAASLDGFAPAMNTRARDQATGRTESPAKLISDASTVPAPRSGELGRPSIVVCMLGLFQVLIDDEQVLGWPNGRGKAIFKYLVIQRKAPVPKEVLMDVFWPDADGGAARNNLNVAIYGLRKALEAPHGGGSFVVYESGGYRLNPALSIWVDAEAFDAHVRCARECMSRGEEASAIAEYRSAEALYQCELLPEDRYEEWFASHRRHYQDLYFNVLEQLGGYYERNSLYNECIAVCRKMVALDHCNETPVRRLMRVYWRINQRHLGFRQYRLLTEALGSELQMSPSPETVQLFERLRKGDAA